MVQYLSVARPEFVCTMNSKNARRSYTDYRVSVTETEGHARANAQNARKEKHISYYFISIYSYIFQLSKTTHSEWRQQNFLAQHTAQLSPVYDSLFCMYECNTLTYVTHVSLSLYFYFLLLFTLLHTTISYSLRRHTHTHARLWAPTYSILFAAFSLLCYSRRVSTETTQ